MALVRKTPKSTIVASHNSHRSGCMLGQVLPQHVVLLVFVTYIAAVGDIMDKTTHIKLACLGQGVCSMALGAFAALLLMSI
jgi:hypothetical protein